MDRKDRFPEDRITRCKRCIYPNTKPDLHFDEHGVCSACRAYDKRKLIDWSARKGELEAILESGRNGSGFDCIVPSSGGKDSHWQVLKLIEMGARPLVVTATTCHLTDIGRRNIDNLARYATTIEVTPNREVRAKLNRLGLRLVGDISWPEHVSIFTTPFQIACKFGIPLIFYGECPQEAYGGPPGTDEARQMTLRWVTEFGGFNGLRPSDLIGKEGIAEADMRDYMPPSSAQMKLASVTAYFLGQFFEWDSHRNARVACARGMQFCYAPSDANVWEHENLDNAQTGIHDYMMYRKFGFGRACAQLSVDIRAGLRDRKASIPILEARDGIFPHQYAGAWAWEVLDRVGIGREEFGDIAARFTNRDLWLSLAA